MNYYIAICGIDGTGKTTLANLLKEKLSGIGSSCISKIKLKSLDVLAELSVKEGMDSRAFYNELPPEIVRYGIALDFSIHYLEHGEELAKFDFVVCDRYYVCYQAYGFAYGVKDMALPNKLFHLPKELELFIFMDLPPSDAVNRLISRGNYVEEEENCELLSNVRDNYLQLLSEKNVLYVDAKLSPELILETVYDRILQEVAARRGDLRSPDTKGE